MKKWLLGGLLAVLAVAIAYPLLGGLGGLSAARVLTARQRWTAARERLESYLWLRPHDERALLLMGETLAKDPQLDKTDAARNALRYLRQIPDSSPLATAARTQEGRLLLLVQHKPYAAEHVLRKAVELDSSHAEAWYYLWKLCDLTNRQEDADAPFWEFYELTPHAKRAAYLSEWYLSQFDTTSANPGLDRELGAIGAHERPSREGEKRRYLLFREAEPDSPIPYAALARWYSTHRDFKTAREMLAEAEARVPAEKRDHPFYLAVSIVLHIELGEFDHATAAFERWPEPHRGFEYWRCRGLVLDEVLGQDEEAIAAYDQAMQVWPGPAEWALRNRKANCLTRLGKTAEAEQARADAAQVVSLMSAALHERLSNALAHPDDPQQLMIVAKFYRDLGRTREAASWLQHISRLRSPSKTL